MSLPFDPTHITDDAIATVLAEVNQRLGEVAQRLDLGDAAPAETEIVKTNRDFGRQLSPISRAAADLVFSCEAVFRGVPCSADGIRTKEVRLRLLQSSIESVDQLAARLRSTQHATRGDLAGDVRTVLQTVEATERHPATSAAVREAVGLAARPIRALLDGRKADARAAYSATRARSSDSETAISQKDEEVAALRRDNTRLTVENRFLAGQPLRPADVTLTQPPRPTAPRRGRRAGGRRGGR